MKEILETIILNIVDNKEKVEITETQKDNTVTFLVKVSKEEMGKVLGKQGRTAKAIRTVMKSIAGMEHKKTIIEFVENE